MVLLTRAKNAEEDWPRESIDELLTVPDDASVDLFVHTATQVARRVDVGQVVALEEYDVITAGLIREHLRLPGMNSAEARLFRDKLAMRVLAKESGMLVPEFAHVLNYDALRKFMSRVEPPWVLKPRSDVSAVGIKKLSEPEQVWRTIDALDAVPELSQQSSSYLLERFIPGQVFHVDALVDDGEVVFAGASRYGRPPMEVAHEGGAFLSYTVEHDSADETTLFELNRQVLKTLGLKRGAAHAEFIKGDADGRFYFLEVASRVGGAYIAETLEAASGVNLWREWARIELAAGDGSYRVSPSRRRAYSGIVLSLARQEFPDTSTYTEPEIIYRVRKQFHAGLVVRSPELARVKQLLEQFARRFAEDFIAVAPPLERPH